MMTSDRGALLAACALSGVALGFVCARYVVPACCTAKSRTKVQRGKVYLIGAGPGAPDLLTVRARNYLQAATVAVMDDLVAKELYELLPPDCEIVYVGKRGGKKDSAKQTDIDDVLVKKARANHVVVRVKGGDPMVFGRVHSEIRALVKAKCAFEVVPGISSALAAPAIVDIPITHKHLSKSFLVISGHKPAEMDFNVLAQIDTISMLMGTRTLETVCTRLMEAGREPKTPVALIHNATLPEQETLLGSLEDIAEKASAKSYSPAIVVIGEVAKYADFDTYVKEPAEDNVV
ncbi:TPA: hypothetical protein N0F65_010424 [Lagenidium giganteum]|uniref:uroporphyrinogen-III C-methyltransferase n=1 Tax=Lagenidium giganteum TaxID=4803 RepID=A0AAV2YUR2_9STRA|nr:TPA: hypothetical protein N0F65_010424 [Lagenidium giganteum]